jgi:hypothetical protein
MLPKRRTCRSTPVSGNLKIKNMKKVKMLRFKISKAILLLFVATFCTFKVIAQTPTVYGDLIMTPIMAYTITPKGSNIPTNFLLANGVKANIGFELGVLFPVFTTDDEARAFIAVGMSRHFLGFDYGGPIINLGEQRISNHRHNRWFLGLKFIPIEKAKYFTLSASAGYGNVVAKYPSHEPHIAHFPNFIH